MLTITTREYLRHSPVDRARTGALITFALAGMFCGVWVSRTPALADKFGLNTGAVGVAVLLWGAGAIVAMQALRGTIARLGSGQMLRWSTPLAALALALVALAPTYTLLLAAVTVFGMAFGLTDVSMNAQASAVERAAGRHVMNRMHAGWCGGAITGGLLGVGTAAAGLTFTEALMIGAAIGLPVAVALRSTYLPDAAGRAGGDGERQQQRRLPRSVALIGVLAFAAFMMEGAMADWSGMFLNRSLGATQAVAALGYPVFEAAMLVGRVSGDRLRTRLGTRRLVVLAGAGTALAVTVVVTAPATPIALAGLVLTGLMVCTVTPTTLSLAGTVAPGQSAAAVTQVGVFGYGGLLLGPVVIGFLANATSLRIGLALAIVLALVIAVGAKTVPTRALVSVPRRVARPAEPRRDQTPERFAA